MRMKTYIRQARFLQGFSEMIQNQWAFQMILFFCLSLILFNGIRTTRGFILAFVSSSLRRAISDVN
jgi:hypothetical protein